MFCVNIIIIKQKKKRIRLKAFKKAIDKEPTVKRCVLTLDLEPITS